MAGVTGDFTRLHQVSATIAGLDQHGSVIRLAVHSELARTAEDLIADGFAGEHDPSGVPWPKSHRAKKESGKTLQDTGRLRDSFNATATTDGFHVTNNVVYAAIHQFGGTVKHPARKQTLKFNSRGRFASRRQKVKRTRTVDIGAHGITIPQRAMLPTSGTIPPAWASEFEKNAALVIQKELERL